MTDLADFLLARIAEDERYAVHAAGMMMGVEAGAHGLAHINRWRPSRVLAECEAKRRIVEQLWDYVAHPDPSSSDPSGTQALWIVKQLAAPYAAHPEYREEWKP